MIAPIRQSPHIRGRVYQREQGRREVVRSAWGGWITGYRYIPPYWAYEVINTRTGQVLASDGARLPLEQIIEDCAEVVELARQAIFWGFERKALR